jgi:uncharacterized membrane protein
MNQANNSTSSGIQPNVAGLLCYLLTWVTGVVFLIIEKQNKFVRFHAFQSVIVFVALWIIYVVFIWTFIIPIIVGVLMFIMWVLLMYQAYKGKMYKVPLAGKWAEKLANSSSAPTAPQPPPPAPPPA